MSKKLLLVFALILAMALVACQPAATEAPPTDAPSTGGEATEAPSGGEEMMVEEINIAWAHRQT